MRWSIYKIIGLLSMASLLILFLLLVVNEINFSKTAVIVWFSAVVAIGVICMILDLSNLHNDN